MLFKLSSKSLQEEEVELFLNSGITPKSISLSHTTAGTYAAIGYTEDTSFEQYRIRYNTFVAPNGITEEEKINLIQIAAETSAQAEGGVICQDIDVTDEGADMFFLIHL